VLDVNDAVLAGFSGYSALTIGRNTGTGAVTTGNA